MITQIENVNIKIFSCLLRHIQNKFISLVFKSGFIFDAGVFTPILYTHKMRNEEKKKNGKKTKIPYLI